MLLYILLTIVIISIYYGFRWKNHKFLELAKKLRIMEMDSIQWPILGLTLNFVGSNETRMKAIQRIGQILNNCGKGLTGAWLGPRFYILVSNPEVTELLLKTNLEKDEAYDSFRPVLGRSSLIAPVSIWRPRRKILGPTFNSRNLNEMVTYFTENSDILVDQLQAKAGKGSFPMEKFLTAYSTDTVCKSVFGVQLNVLKQPDEVPFFQANVIGQKLISERIWQPWLHSDMIYKLLPRYRVLQNCLKIGKDFVDEVIVLKRRELQKTNFEYDDRPMKTYLEHIMLTSKYNDVELFEELLMLVIAGTDTIASNVGFTMLLLARHPDVQEKVYEELQKVLGDSDRRIEPEDLQRLIYLEAVIKESLRLYPPGPVILRRVTNEVTLRVTIVKGCGVFVNIWALHRNPAYWGADAEQFRPERFIDTPFKHPAQFMPFSWGPRNCPGSQYAMMSAKTTLASILRQYRVLPPAGDVAKPIRPTFEIMMKEADEFTVSLESRKTLDGVLDRAM